MTYFDDEVAVAEETPVAETNGEVQEPVAEEGVDEGEKKEEN